MSLSLVVYWLFIISCNRDTLQVFFVSRIIIYPVYICYVTITASLSECMGTFLSEYWKSMTPPPPYWWAFNGMLITLLCLHMFWFRCEAPWLYKPIQSSSLIIFAESIFCTFCLSCRFFVNRNPFSLCPNPLCSIIANMAIQFIAKGNVEGDARSDAESELDSDDSVAATQDDKDTVSNALYRRLSQSDMSLHTKSSRGGAGESDVRLHF